jgi:TrmH family RNA methyltransferase
MSAGQQQQYNGCLLTEAQRDRLEVVLVAPRNPLNMGAAARAMANFGFAHLAVVAPFEAHWREARSAVGAPDLLHAAKEAQTLAEAIAPCTLVVGTGTLTYRKPEQPVVPLPLLTPFIQQEIRRGGHVALVFGPEKHGLTREDLSYCHLLVEIPTDPRQPSMNLGQAVAVALYELVRQVAEEKSASAATPRNTIETAPNSASGMLERLADAIEETMKAAGYSPRIMQAANRHDLRLLMRRLRWTEADAKHALGLFRRVLWRLAHPHR